jgi:hypothetical protein
MTGRLCLDIPPGKSEEPLADARGSEWRLRPFNLQSRDREGASNASPTNRLLTRAARNVPARFQ